MEKLPLFTLSFSHSFIRIVDTDEKFPAPLYEPFDQISTIDPYSAACRFFKELVPQFEKFLTETLAKADGKNLNRKNVKISFEAAIKVHAEDVVTNFPDIWYDCRRHSGGVFEINRRTKLTLADLQTLAGTKGLPSSGTKNLVQCKIDLFDFFFAMKFNRKTLLALAPKHLDDSELSIKDLRATVVRDILPKVLFESGNPGHFISFPDSYIFREEFYDFEDGEEGDSSIEEVIKAKAFDVPKVNSKPSALITNEELQELIAREVESRNRSSKSKQDKKEELETFQKLKDRIKELEKARKDQDDHFKVEMENMKILSEENESLNRIILKQREELESLKKSNSYQIQAVLSSHQEEPDRLKGLYETRISILQKANLFLSEEVTHLKEKLEEKDRVLGETLEEIEQERSRVELLESELHQEKLLNSIQPTKSSTRKTLEDEFFNNMLFLENAPSEVKKERAKKGFNPVSFITGMF